MFVQFTSLPNTMEDFSKLVEAHRKSPHHMAALLLTALHVYPQNRDLAFQMVEMLKGNAPLNDEEKNFISMSMNGSEYLPESYMDGAIPLNNYTPRFPYTVSFTDTLAQPADGYLTVYVRTSGAEYPRAVTLREENGGWYPSDWSELFLAIRPPAHGTRAGHTAE